MLKEWSDFFVLWGLSCLVCLLLCNMSASARSPSVYAQLSMSFSPAKYEGPSGDMLAAILYLTGALSVEELSEEEMEHWRELAESPLEVNLSSRSRLEKSGLLTSYQIASLLDYRERCGDVMSFAELAAVDGFGKEMSDALKPFVSLMSSSSPLTGAKYGRRPHNSLIANSSSKIKNPGNESDAQYAWNTKYTITSQGRFSAGVSLKNDWQTSRWTPYSASAYASVIGKRYLSMLSVGDFSLHFGQGLALWTGFSMSGVQSSTSFWKRPTGIRPSQSLSSSSTMRGVAAQLDFGRLSISAFTAFPGLRPWMEDDKKLVASVLPGINASWHSKYGAVSITMYGAFDGKVSSSKMSADIRYCIRGIEVFGEASLDAVTVIPAANGGVLIPFGDKWKLAMYGRWIPAGYAMEYCAPMRSWSGKTGESGVAAGLSYGSVQLLADFARLSGSEKRQVKAQLLFPWKISENASLAFSLRDKWQNRGVGNRTDVRADLKLSYGNWQTSFRANAVATDSFAGLVYADEGYAGRLGAVFLRGTLFLVDKWNDRIYCYERDAPGNFNVPAYYGRGYSVSLVTKMTLRFVAPEKKRGASAMKLWLRAGFTDTPWRPPSASYKRVPKLELKAQMSYSF